MNRCVRAIGTSVLLWLAVIAVGPAHAEDEICHTVSSDQAIAGDITANDIAFTVTGPTDDGTFTYTAHTDKGTVTTVSGVLPTITHDDGVVIGGGAIELGDTLIGVFVSLTACYETASAVTTTAPPEQLPDTGQQDDLANLAFALEDGIMETTSFTPNEDSTHADFERVITNLTEGPIDVAPRDLRMMEYPIMTITSITADSFDNGIWTVGTLAGGQTASIAYTGDAAPTESTTTTAPTTTTTIAATTTVAPAATTTTAPEELPHTGHRDHLAVFAIAGLALIVLGISLLRATRA